MAAARPRNEGNTVLLTNIGYGLSGLLGLAIVGIGTRFLLAPRAAAAGFRIAIGRDGGSANPYLSVKGVRDIASGLVVFILLAAGNRACWAGSCWRPASSPSATPSSCCGNGPKATVYGVHAATAAVMLAAATFLFV